MTAVPPAPQAPGPDPAAVRRDLHVPVHAVRGRQVAVLLGACALVVFCGGALLVPGTGPGGFVLVDRVLMVSVGLAIAWFLSRWARVAVLPDEQGLLVRNLFTTRRLDWAQVVAVRFGGGGPWAVLDLADGETLALLAVQRADGPRAEASARRLATLVALHTQVSHDG